jgi:signal transduction histidine kinase
VVAVAAAIGSIALVTILGHQLRHDVQGSALVRAKDIANSLAIGTPPSRLPLYDQDNSFVQVIAPHGPGHRGKVVAASPRLRAVAPLAPAGGSVTRIVAGRSFMQGERFLVVTHTVSTPRGPMTVAVGNTLEEIDRTVSIVGRSLAVGVPLLIALTVALMLLGVGRALRPVELIRTRVAGITATHLNQRVPVPAGRDEIARLAATMNEMLDRLERAQSRQRRFVSDASHELRNPVAAIRQLVEGHRNGALPREIADDVLVEDLRLQELIEDLLLLARLDEAGPITAASEIDVDDLLLAEARYLRSRGVNVDARGVSPVRISGVPRQVQRALRNVTENAVRHARGSINLSCALQGDSAVVEVDDDGEGISPEHRDVVFERFTRLDDARTRDDGGAGLGLAIAAEIVAAHGGHIDVEKSPLGGARIRMTLPALEFSDPSGGSP